jgi:hypothetical protein
MSRTVSNFRLVFGLSIGLAASACGSGVCNGTTNELDGSMKELYDITVDKVEARWNADDDTVTIDFKRGSDSHAKVVANSVSAARIGDGIPLITGDVYRVTSKEGDAYPAEIARGSITFESALTVNSEIEGCFNCLFVLEDGSQRTLSGDFRTVLDSLEQF